MLQGQTAVVTGASRELAEQLLWSWLKMEPILL